MTERPVTMRDSATALHEWYTNLREAGFTRMEALYLIAVSIRPENRDQN